MADSTCPKCKRKTTDPSHCSECGINFNEYAELKYKKLSEVSCLLGEGKFLEAKKIAEQLPLEFPDDRNDFILLLSNINRDINIVGKCKQAEKCFHDGDYVQAAFLLRNIKAFDKKLDEKVIFLRRKIERQLQSDEKFSKAVEAFDQGNYGSAIELFAEVEDPKHKDRIARYLEKIEETKGNLLNEAVQSIREGRLNTAAQKIENLRTIFPNVKVIDGYATVVAKRIEIQNSILDAARKALGQKRYIEAKILNLFLFNRFPDVRHQVQNSILEIGDKAIVTIADLNDHGIVNLAELGLDADIDGSIEFLSVPDERKEVIAAYPTPDFIDADEPSLAAANEKGIPDTFNRPAEFGGAEVADFIF